MSKRKLKYKLADLIELLPRHVSIGKLEQILSSEHGISRDSFYRDRSMFIEDESTIPSDRLEVYAALFDVSVDELKNYKPKKIKPLIKRKSFSVDQVKTITGLKTSSKVHAKKINEHERIESVKSITGLKSKQ